MENKINHLTDRQKREAAFHNKWAESVEVSDINYQGAFGAVTAIENRYALSFIDLKKGIKILDLGCGIGDATAYFALQGMSVTALDISNKMIDLVVKLTSELGVGQNVTAVVGGAEKIDCKDESFDVVFGNGVLHHVDYETALKEVYRVLKPGGKAIFVEPLMHNPVINIYRKIAKKVRSVDEKPLSYQKIMSLKEAGFKKYIHHEFHFFTLLIFVWFFVGERVSPNESRYWKKIIDEANKYERVFRILHRMDELLWKYMPIVRKYYWNSVLVFEK